MVKIDDACSSDDEKDLEEEKIDMNELLSGVDDKTRGQLLMLRSVLSCDQSYKGLCVICQLEFSNKIVKELVILPCSHVYHKSCAIKWLKLPNANMRCPHCKCHAISGE